MFTPGQGRDAAGAGSGHEAPRGLSWLAVGQFCTAAEPTHTSVALKTRV